jgi:hypothetical protein
MNRQSHWLFEAPTVSKFVSQPNHEYYRNPEEQTEWELPEAFPFYEEEWETVGRLKVPRRSIPRHFQGTQVPRSGASSCPPISIQSRIVSGWSQYKQRVQELPADQQDILRKIGNEIRISYQPGCQPVRKVQVYGHADWDTPRNPQREQQISDERTLTVTNWLKNYVGSTIAPQITWDTQGFGATRLKAPPTTEANRRQNRRVETSLISQSTENVLICPYPPTKNRDFTGWLQRSLNDLMKIQLPTHGKFCSQTQGALGHFQVNAKLPKTGVVDHQTYRALRAAGAPLSPCTVITPFPNLYKPIVVADPLFSGKLKQKLDQHLPSNQDIAFTIARLEPDPATFNLCVCANYNENIMHFSGSLLKVVIAYASFELLAAANRLVDQSKPSTTSQLLERLESCFTPAITDNFDKMLQNHAGSIKEKCPPPNVKLTDIHKKPKYEKLFVLNSTMVEFTPEYFTKLRLIFANQNQNETPIECIHRLGYGYIAGALEKAGFFEPSKANGIWLAGDYSNRTQFPYICVNSQNDLLAGQAMTTFQMTNLFALLHHKRLFRLNPYDNDRGFNDKMLNLLSLPGSWLQAFLDARMFRFTHAKVGHAFKKDKTEVFSEGSILQFQPQGSNSKVQNYVVVWQNCPNRSLFRKIFAVIKDTIPYP